MSGKGCGLWLWHSLGFSLNCFAYISEKNERKTFLILLRLENMKFAQHAFYIAGIFFFFFFFFFLTEVLPHPVHKTAGEPSEIGTNPALYIHLWKRVTLAAVLLTEGKKNKQKKKTKKTNISFVFNFNVNPKQFKRQPPPSALSVLWLFYRLSIKCHWAWSWLLYHLISLRKP